MERNENMKIQKSWHKITEEETNFIIQNWKTMPYHEIGKVLNLSTKTISSAVATLKEKGMIDKEHWANRSTQKDLTNKRFGSVIAQKFLYLNPEYRAVWLCLCDCGNTVEIGTHNLKRNKFTSCGCLTKKRSIDRIKKQAYKGHTRGAREREYITYLSIEEYLDISSKKCVYCEKISIRKNPDTGDFIEMNSVDRIDNEPYYKLENSQSVCFICQRMKSDMEHESFLNHVAAIQTCLKIKKPPQS